MSFNYGARRLRLDFVRVEVSRMLDASRVAHALEDCSRGLLIVCGFAALYVLS